MSAVLRVGEWAAAWSAQHPICVLAVLASAVAGCIGVRRVRRNRRRRRIWYWDPHRWTDVGTGESWGVGGGRGAVIRPRKEKRRGGGRGVSPAPASGSPAFPSEKGRARAGRRLALIIIEVASRLRAGTPTARAWALAWYRHEKEHCGRVDDRGIPEALYTYARAQKNMGLLGYLRGAVSSGNADAVACRHAARAVIASCTMSHMLGCQLADVLDAVASGIEQEEEAENARRIAGAAPELSARILSVLPFAGVAAAEFLGAHPLTSYVDGGAGSVCCLVGLSCMACGHLLSRFLRRRACRGEETRSGLDAAMLCDLTCAALQSGAAVPTTLMALGAATECDELVYAGKQLRYGVSWESAWEGCPPESALMSYALEPAWCDGTSPENLLRRSAHHLRSRRLADAQAEAEKLSVQLVAPLGIFMLPSFISLGVIPVFLSLIAGTLG